ncbi:nucleotidyltransferase domain-containing protein [Candidatus Woesearchaeota archaeon]|nr:nucleotidyltransferase domain-containing protein [Candidatus Woesearchaeota archaeon]
MVKKKQDEKVEMQHEKAPVSDEEKAKREAEFAKEREMREKELLDKLPKEAQEKLKAIKEKLEKFKEQAVKKLDKYIIGISLLPPPKPQEGKKPDLDTINVLVLIDDSDSQKLSKQDLKAKLAAIMDSIAKEIDEKMLPQTIILSEVWQSCFDAKYDVLSMIAMSAPVYERGMMSAIKIAELHKSMVLKKFEKYIVSYILFGSLVRGEATSESDIDVAIVIDDTDVKKMTRAELKDKLRAIIIGMGIEAGDMTGIRNKLNIQVYILTDFWDSLKEANPVIFTILRDGIPLYDRGLFMPWKQMLRMGKIKPSAEAIDMFMSSGEQMLKRVQFKLKEIGMEDLYYALLTPSQAALMLHGVPPPTPRETAKLMREIFVKKEKMLDDSMVDILEGVVELRKKIEHGEKQEVTGKELDTLMTNAEKYLARIKKLFGEIETAKEEEDMVQIYETTLTIIKDALRVEGIEKTNDHDLVKYFEKHLVQQGKIPEPFLKMLQHIVKAKKDYDDKKLTKVEVDQVKKEGRDFMRFVVEYIQRKRGRELERAKIRIKHGEKFGEVVLLGNEAFIIHDLDAPDKEISKATIVDGRLTNVQSSSLEEFEKALTSTAMPPKMFLKEHIFEQLKNVFGKDVEILVHG